MSRKDLTQFKGISFDIIGTLADYEAGVLAWCRPRLPKHLTDNEILECFAQVEKSLHVSLVRRPPHVRWHALQHASNAISLLTLCGPRLYHFLSQ